jgi:hypothetical protein
MARGKVEDTANWGLKERASFPVFVPILYVLWAVSRGTSNDSQAPKRSG